MVTAVKLLLVGNPLKSQQAVHERLTQNIALAVFSAGGFSSTFYDSDETLVALAASVNFGPASAFRYVVPISIGIDLLHDIVDGSYRQTIDAYPSGGGAYIVAKENLGTTPVFRMENV